MSKFWPSRPSPEGFSIEKLAKRYREKISKTSYEISESNFQENEVSINKSMESIDSNPKEVISEPKEYIHWANRDFLEYQDAA